MDILIITTYYPPDTAVAAVRPYAGKISHSSWTQGNGSALGRFL